MAEGQDKVSKESVNYSAGKEASHCGNCVFFQPNDNPFASGTCEKVSGAIQWHRWCKKWKGEDDL